MTAKNTVCLWYDHAAEEAANFYARTFPDSGWSLCTRPRRLPFGKQGDVITVEFTVMGIPCVGLNGGSAKHCEAFSFQVSTVDQAETDRLWEAIVGNGGEASVCGWCKDKWGISWQITPHPHRSHRPPRPCGGQACVQGHDADGQDRCGQVAAALKG
jgi:2-polyprenyl-6-hydroxyphenyl methylase/3-demethylubiquinone-9 3-methyltransferase